MRATDFHILFVKWKILMISVFNLHLKHKLKSHKNMCKKALNSRQNSTHSRKRLSWLWPFSIRSTQLLYKAKNYSANGNCNTELNRFWTNKIHQRNSNRLKLKFVWIVRSIMHTVQWKLYTEFGKTKMFNKTSTGYISDFPGFRVAIFSFCFFEMASTAI